MNNKVILPILFGILIIGVTQFTFAEELEKATYVAVDEEKINRPESTYENQELTIRGYIEDYARGVSILLTIINPDESELEIKTHATKKGDVFTVLPITEDYQFGIHQVIMNYNGTLASTSFEILDNRSDFQRWKDNSQ